MTLISKSSTLKRQRSTGEEEDAEIVGSAEL